MLTVAVTGNVASGKSLLCGIWAEEGVPVVQADELARQVVEPGTDGHAAVVREFGTGVLEPSGALNRTALRHIVFRDPAARKRLEEIIHPAIAGLRDQWMRSRTAEGHSLVVAEIPLLFEAGLEGDYDLIVVVHSPEKERLRRLVENRSLDQEEAQRIMAAQMPAEEKRERADFVVPNDGGPEDLRTRALALLDLLRARARDAARDGS